MASRAVNETTVLYKAIADFSDLKKKAATAKQDIKGLTDEYGRLNRETKKKLPEPGTDSKAKINAVKTAIQQLNNAYKSTATAAGKSTTAINANKKALVTTKYKTQEKAVRALADAYDDLNKKIKSSNTSLGTQNRRLDASMDKFNDYADYVKQGREEQEVFNVATEETTEFQQALKKAISANNTSLQSQNKTLNTASNRMDAYGKRTEHAADVSDLLSRSSDDAGVSLAFVQESAFDATEVLKDYNKTVSSLSRRKVAGVSLENPRGGGRGGGGGRRRTPQFSPTDDADNAGHILPDRFGSDGIREATEEVGRLNRALGKGQGLLGKLTKGFDGLANKRVGLAPTLPVFLGTILALASAIGPLVSLIGALGAAIFGLGVNLASATGSAAVLAPLLFGLIGVVASLKLAFNGVGDALKAGMSGDIEAYDAALSKLSPSAQTATRALVDQAGAWREVRSQVQEAFFAPFADRMDDLALSAPAVGRALSNIAGALGRVGDKAISLVTSDRFLANMEKTSKGLEPVIENIGDGVLSLLDGFMALSVAATPILEDMTKGFKDWAKSVEETFNSGLADGSLQDYLDKAYESLKQWGRIVGNIAQTLYNYGVAAEPFGKWMTDGLEELTKGWKTNSEDAMKDGSPFKKFLEDIKPLLTEVGGLVGDFFKWFSETAMDPENIKDMTDLVKLIREDLGPALGDMLDTLSKTEIDEAIVSFFSSIIKLVDSMLANGGAKVLESIAIFLSDTADAVSDLVEDNPEFAKFVADAILLVTGLVLVGKSATAIKGVLTALGGLARLILPAAVVTFLSELKNVKFPAALTRLKTFLSKLVPPKWIAGLGKGGLIGAIVGGASVGGGEIQKGISEALPDGNPLKSIHGGLGQIMQFDMGGIEEMQKGLEGLKNTTLSRDELLGDLKNATPPWTHWAQDLAISAADWGLKITNFIQKIPEELANFGGDIWSNLQDVGTWLDEQRQTIELFFRNLPEIINMQAANLWAEMEKADMWLDEQKFAIEQWFRKLPHDIANMALDIWNGLGKFGLWLEQQWQDAVFWFQQLPYNIMNLAVNLWNGLIQLTDWLTTQWNAGQLFFQGLPAKVEQLKVDMWSGLTQFIGWLGTQWTAGQTWFQEIGAKASEAAGDFWDRLIGPETFLGKKLEEFLTWARSLPGEFVEGVGDLWNGLAGPDTWLGQRLAEIVLWLTVTLPNSIANNARNIWNNIPGIGPVLQRIGNEAINWAARLPSQIAEAIGNIFRFVSGFFSMNFNLGGLVRPPNPGGGGGAGRNTGRAPRKGIGRNKGGPIPGTVLKRANGGDSVVPGRGNVDKVPAMLTPGEFVIRQAVTNRIGKDKLAKLNSGILSYGDLLRQLMSEKAVNSGTSRGTSEMSFLNGGGMVPSFDNVGSTVANSFQSSLSTVSSNSSSPTTVVENLNIYNPVPETASESLPKTLRRRGYMD